MTIISKVLAVILATASLAFLGFVTLNLVGGVNWQAEQDVLSEHYNFEFVPGTETTTHSVNVTHRVTGTAVGSGHPNWPAAITAAHQDWLQRQQTELAGLQLKINGDPAAGQTSLKAQIEETEKFERQDEAAVQAHIARLEADLLQLKQDIDLLIQEEKAKAQEAYTLDALTKLRGQDIHRLETQLDEIRTDRYQAEKHKLKLTDLVNQLEANIERLKRRREQLLQMGARASTG